MLNFNEEFTKYWRICLGCGLNRRFVRWLQTLELTVDTALHPRRLVLVEQSFRRMPVDQLLELAEQSLCDREVTL